MSELCRPFFMYTYVQIALHCCKSKGTCVHASEHPTNNSFWQVTPWTLSLQLTKPGALQKSRWSAKLDIPKGRNGRLNGNNWWFFNHWIYSILIYLYYLHYLDWGSPIFKQTLEEPSKLEGTSAQSSQSWGTNLQVVSIQHPRKPQTVVISLSNYFGAKTPSGPSSNQTWIAGTSPIQIDCLPECWLPCLSTARYLPVECRSFPLTG